MGKEVKDGDHVILGEMIGEHARAALVLGENGEVSQCVATTNKTDSGRQFHLEPCPVSSVNMFHVCSTGHKGPARANSKDYCKGWERIFGSRKRKEDIN